MKWALPSVGLEPTHLAAQVPKTCMSTNFITRAWMRLCDPYFTNHTKAEIRCQVAATPNIWRCCNFYANSVFSSLIPCYVLSQNLSIRERIRSLLGTLIHSVYTQHNLLFGARMRFGWLYNHSKAPFLKHRLDRHVHTAYTQCKFGKFWLHVT